VGAKPSYGVRLMARIVKKICPTCGNSFLDDVERAVRGKHKTYCGRKCMMENLRLSGANIRRHLKLRYGLENEDYLLLFEAQKGLCACCGKMLSRDKRGTHIDHNHATGEIRGTLCRGCNMKVAVFDHPLRKVYEAYVDQGGFI
jgi:hypothetical protein